MRFLERLEVIVKSEEVKPINAFSVEENIDCIAKYCKREFEITCFAFISII